MTTWEQLAEDFQVEAPRQATSPGSGAGDEVSQAANRLNALLKQVEVARKEFEDAVARKYPRKPSAMSPEVK